MSDATTQPISDLQPSSPEASQTLLDRLLQSPLLHLLNPINHHILNLKCHQLINLVFPEKLMVVYL